MGSVVRLNTLAEVINKCEEILKNKGGLFTVNHMGSVVRLNALVEVINKYEEILTNKGSLFTVNHKPILENDGDANMYFMLELSRKEMSVKQELLKLVRKNKETIHRHYVGYIEKQCNDTWLVRFSRHVEGKKFKWPEREDVSTIDEGQIEKNIKSTQFYLSK